LPAWFVIDFIMSGAARPGLQIPAHKQTAREAAITSAAVADILVLMLDQHGDGELHPCVQPGEVVAMGQVIAHAASPLGASLHSSVSGLVLAIEMRNTLKRDATQGQAIIVRNDHLDRRVAAVPTLDWQALTPIALCEQLARGGIVGLGGAVFPAATKLAAHQHHAIDYLLINGVECEPYICCDDRLMRERATEILLGVQILLHAAQAAHCKVVIESDKPEALQAMQAALITLDDARIEVQVIPCAYPSGDEGQLIRQVLGREVPRGGLPADIGVIVQNVATAYACAHWLLHGRPLISRIVTVTGAGVAQPANLEVRIGTRMSDLIATCGGHQADSFTPMLIMGGAMMGRSLSDDQLPIVKSSNCLIVGAQSAHTPARIELPCIRCGECAEACPVNLLPQQLLVHARGNNASALNQLGLADCIECGCCDYVCPSNITLAARFHAAKQLVR
jgi:Na+-translocating ferredoxin:NAD+ oxidoreductase subunit C